MCMYEYISVIKKRLWYERARENMGEVDRGKERRKMTWQFLKTFKLNIWRKALFPQIAYHLLLEGWLMFNQTDLLSRSYQTGIAQISGDSEDPFEHRPICLTPHWAIFSTNSHLSQQLFTHFLFAKKTYHTGNTMESWLLKTDLQEIHYVLSLTRYSGILLIITPQGQRQVDVCEFKVNWVYIANSRKGQLNETSPLKKKNSIKLVPPLPII